MDSHGKKYWLVILHGVCWGIWKERNKRFFNGVSKPALEVAESIAFEVALQALACKGFEDFSINDLIRDWLLYLSSCLKFLDYRVVDS